MTDARQSGRSGLRRATEGVAEVELEMGDTILRGYLAVPDDSRGLVLFAHGSGSGRHSPRNRYVAEQLNGRGLATLLFDLLTADEERDRRNVFDIAKLGARLSAASEWARGMATLRDQPLGYFGASTGAGAALWAAGQRHDVDSVVSRGGRPDLAGDILPRVEAATLLIVGGRDRVVEELNREAQDRLRCESRLAVVPGAGHLFEEPGALDEVARLAGDWFLEKGSPQEVDR